MLAKSKIFMVSFLIVIIIILMALIVPIGHKTPVPALDPAGGFARVPDSKN
jgi:hypothetical protein